MKLYLVQIRDAEPARFIILLGLIFSGMIARPAVDWDLSKEMFLMIPGRKQNPDYSLYGSTNLFLSLIKRVYDYLWKKKRYIYNDLCLCRNLDQNY